MEQSKASESTQEKEEIMTVYKPKSTTDKKDLERGAEAIATFTKPLILMLLWNALMPGLFGLATIGYLKAFGLYLMSRILFNHNVVELM